MFVANGARRKENNMHDSLDSNMHDSLDRLTFLVEQYAIGPLQEPPPWANEAWGTPTAEGLLEWATDLYERAYDDAYVVNCFQDVDLTFDKWVDDWMLLVAAGITSHLDLR